MKTINSNWKGRVNRTSVQTASTEVSKSRIMKAITAKGVLVEELPPAFINDVVNAVNSAALFQDKGGLPNKYTRAGPPADNSRIILVHDIKKAAKNNELGGWRDEDPKSIAVLVFEAVSGLIWPGGANVRTTYRRLKRSKLKVEPTRP